MARASTAGALLALLALAGARTAAARMETVLRFDCKLALVWFEDLGKFGIFDGGVKYQTTGTFESFMWHHSGLVVSEDGVARVYVDGELQELAQQTANGVEIRGTEVAIQQYPNRCPNSYSDEIGIRRAGHLGEPELPMDAPVHGTSNAPVRDGYLAGYNETSHRFEVDGLQPFTANGCSTGTANTGAPSCTFRMASGCESPIDVMHSLDGFIDEVAVWNRPLTQSEVSATMFDMPQYMSSIELSAPNGVQLDYTAGRVLYARFNNPCMEASPRVVPQAPAPVAPAPIGLGGRRFLNETEEVFADSVAAHSWVPKAAEAAAKSASGDRRTYVSDYAVRTAGAYHADDGHFTVLDGADRIELISLRNSAKYVYTGVPWAAPMVVQASVRGVPETLPAFTKDTPEGGKTMVTMGGIGFAKSKFMKCFTYAHDGTGNTPVGDSVSENAISGPYDTHSYTRSVFTVAPKGDAYTYESVPMQREINGAMVSNVHFMDAAVAYTPFELLPHFDSRDNRKPDRKTYPNSCPAPSITDPCPEDYPFPTGGSAICGYCPDDGIPRERSDWTVIPSNPNSALRQGRVPPFQSFPCRGVDPIYGHIGCAQSAAITDNFFDDFIYGGYETVVCEHVNTVTPSDLYYVGVTNDGSKIGSPPIDARYTEHALRLDGQSSVTISTNAYVEASPKPTGKAFSMWFKLTGGIPSEPVVRLMTMSESIAVQLHVFQGVWTLKLFSGDLVYDLKLPGGVDAVVEMATWHNVAFSVDPQIVYYDGVALDISFVSLASANAKELQSVATGFVGEIDEIRVFDSGIAPAAFESQILGVGAGVVAKIPFTAQPNANPIVHPDPMAKLGGIGLAKLVPYAAPWTPTHITHVNGQRAHAEQSVGDFAVASVLTSSPPFPAQKLKVVGSNFGDSSMLKCMWGTDVESVNQAQFEAGDEVEYFKMVTKYETDVEFVSETEVYCATPVAEDSETLFFAVGAPYFAVYTQHHFTNAALECDGMGDYANANTVPQYVTGGDDNSWTVAMWVLPYAAPLDRPSAPTPPPPPPTAPSPPPPQPPSPPPPDTPAPATRKLQSNDKTIRTRNVGEGAMNETTILAFESSAADGLKNEALLMYDGERFFYYDDNILDAASTSTHGSRPEEWHYVVLVMKGGEGDLYVDGVMHEHFTTASKVTPASSLTVCADSNKEGNAASFFFGQIDQLRFWNIAAPIADGDVLLMAFEDKFADAALSFDFTAGPLLPSSVASTDGTADMVVSSGAVVMATAPWKPITTVLGNLEELDPQDITDASCNGEAFEVTINGGNTHVISVASNLAPSQWLGMRYDFEGSDAAFATPAELPAVAKGGDAPPTALAAITQPPIGAGKFGTLALVNDATRRAASAVPERFCAGTAATTVDLTRGLMHYMPMDAKNGDHVMDLVTGTSAGTYDAVMATMDRDQFEAAAYMTGVAGSELDLDVAEGAKSMCAWVFLLYPAAGEAPLPVRAGGWKLLCQVDAADGVKTYLNGATELEGAALAFYAPIATALRESGKATFAGAIDDLWLWDRALTGAELTARYMTSEYAIDLSRGGAVNATVKGIDGKVTVEAWILPRSLGKYQTIFASQGPHLAFGLNEDMLSFAVAVETCAAEPCSGFREYASPKATVYRGAWQHVAVAYDGTSMMFFVDGIMMDYVSYDTAAPVLPTEAFYIGREGAADLAHPLLGVPENVRAFDGLVYDIDVASGATPPFWQKADVQCTRRDRTNTNTYVHFEGVGDATTGYGAGEIAVSGLAGKYVDASYDDATVGSSTTRVGAAALESPSSADGQYTITARDACGKKRLFGGEAFTVEMAGVGAPDPTVTVEDAQDGNYHVTYAGACGEYDSSIKLDGVVVDTFKTVVVPSATSAAASEIAGGEPLPVCYATEQTFTIQAKDAHGCNKNDEADKWHVIVRGPHDVNATVTPIGAGKYKASFVPQQAGTYQVDVVLEAEDGSLETMTNFCLAVCAGGSASFDGGNGIEVLENDHHDLDLAAANVTVSAWIKPAAAAAAKGYVLFKGTQAEADSNAYTKTYQMYVEGDKLCAAFYVGRAETRTACGTFVPGAWAHFAAVYSGDKLAVYKDGSKAAEETFATAKPVHDNTYYHPLNIGYLFNGLVDDVKLQFGALTDAEIKQEMHCPLFRGDDVAAYFSFNEKFSPNVRGFGTRACQPDSSAFLGESCLVGPLAGVALVDETPIEKPRPVVATSSHDAGYEGALSYVAGTTLGVARVHADDQCGYHYVEGDADAAFTSDVVRLDTSYEGPICPEYPRVDRVPQPAQPVQLFAPSSCRTRNFDQGYVRGDVYDVKLGATAAGRYEVTTKDAEGGSFEAVVATAVAGAPAKIVMTGAAASNNPEAGVPYALPLQLYDAYDNLVEAEHAISVKYTLVGAPYTVVVEGTQTWHGSFYDDHEPMYVSEATFSKAGQYTIVMALADAAASAEVFLENAATGALERLSEPSIVVDKGRWRTLATNDANANMPSTARRFEHSAWLSNETGDLYVWGGAAFDKSYLGDLHVLRNANGVMTKESNYFAKEVVVTSDAATPEAATVEVIVNTAELIGAAKMHPACFDVSFAEAGTGPLFFYIEANTINAENTRVFLRLPAGFFAEAGSKTVMMYYGNAAAVEPSAYFDPTKALDAYEGFEQGNGTAAWKLDEGCGSATSALTLEHGMEHEAAFAGDKVLMMTGSGKVAYEGAKDLGKGFKVVAQLWDDGSCKSAAYMSPDFTSCTLTADGDKVTLPDDSAPLDARSTALGTYTLSTADKYAVSSPWQSTSQARAAGWHKLEVVSSPVAGMKALIDGVEVKASADAIDFRYVSLTTGLGVDAEPHAELKDAVSFWDELVVFKYHEGITTAAKPMAEDKAVASVESRDWAAVEVSGEQPPPRYSHTMVEHEGAHYLFGGERSSYAFADVWMLTIDEVAGKATWTYITPKTAHGTAAGAGAVPEARFDHAAVVVDGKMIISGGRTRKDVLSDVWALDLKTHAWEKIADATAMGARFGHAAVASGDAWYAQGGYTEAGFSGAFFKCGADGQCADLTLGCPEAPGMPTLATLGAEPRMSHAMATDGGNFVFMYGGMNYEQETLGFAAVYRFAVRECQWEQVLVEGAEMPRYEMAVTYANGNLIMHGGHVDGGFEDHVAMLAV